MKPESGTVEGIRFAFRFGFPPSGVKVSCLTMAWRSKAEERFFGGKVCPHSPAILSGHTPSQHNINSIEQSVHTMILSLSTQRMMAISRPKPAPASARISDTTRYALATRASTHGARAHKPEFSQPTTTVLAQQQQLELTEVDVGEIATPHPVCFRESQTVK